MLSAGAALTGFAVLIASQSLEPDRSVAHHRPLTVIASQCSAPAGIVFARYNPGELNLVESDRIVVPAPGPNSAAPSTAAPNSSHALDGAPNCLARPHRPKRGFA